MLLREFGNAYRIKTKPAVKRPPAFIAIDYYVQPARCSSTSAAFPFLLDLINSVTGIQNVLDAIPGHSPGCLLIGGSGSDGLVHARFSLFLRSVHDAARFSTSAAAGCSLRLFSATGTGFAGSAAGGSWPTGDGKSSGPDQAGYAHTGEQTL